MGKPYLNNVHYSKYTTLAWVWPASQIWVSIYVFKKRVSLYKIEEEDREKW